MNKRMYSRRRLRRLALLLALFVVGVAILLLGTGAFGRSAVHGGGVWSALGLGPQGWTVGELHPNGLRIIPSGRSDGSAVLNPEQFASPTVRHAYWVATQIPATLNQLYCWCGCENRGVHRSNLQCFEDQMGENCDVCQGTAEIAYRMVQQGITDAGRIQATVDARWAPQSAS